MRLLPGLDEFFQPPDKDRLIERRDRHLATGSRRFRCRSLRRFLPFLNLTLLGDGEFLNPPVTLRRVCFVLAGEEHGLLDTEGSSVNFQLLKRLTSLEGDLRVPLQMEPAIGFDDDHLTPPLTTSGSHEPRYKSTKTENDLFNIQALS